MKHPRTKTNSNFKGILKFNFMFRGVDGITSYNLNSVLGIDQTVEMGDIREEQREEKQRGKTSSRFGEEPATASLART